MGHRFRNSLNWKKVLWYVLTNRNASDRLERRIKYWHEEAIRFDGTGMMAASVVSMS
jgi:hypothetical protein